MVTSFELRARTSNLLNEQKERLERLAKQKAKEEAIQNRLREKQKQLEEQQRLKRLAELEEQEKVGHLGPCVQPLSAQCAHPGDRVHPAVAEHAQRSGGGWGPTDVLMAPTVHA